jgi:hypothetical protein
MPINFPNAPTNGQSYQHYDLTYVFSSSGNTWISSTTAVPDKQVLYSDGGTANGAVAVTYEKSNSTLNITGTLNLLD